MTFIINPQDPDIGGAPPPPPPPPAPTPPGSPPPPAPSPAPVIPPSPGSVFGNVVGSSATGTPSFQIQSIDLAAVPAQTLAVQLGQQSCTISVFQKTTGLYLDLLVNDAPVALSALCQNGNFLIRDANIGFDGELMMVDLQGSADPDYTGIGNRFVLFWVHAV